MKPFARIREDRGISLQLAAARLRMCPQHLRALEKGRKPLGYTVAQQMAKFYGCTVWELVQPPSILSDLPCE